MPRPLLAHVGDHLFTVRETQHILKIAKTTVYEMVRRGDLRAIKLGRCCRIDGRSVRRVLGEVEADSRGSRL